MQFAKAAGATVIATTSSASKAETLKKLGADHVLNYKQDPNWGETARKLTPNNSGVDHIIEVGGPGTLDQSFKAIKFEGVISIIGLVAGSSPKGNPQVMDALTHICTLRGVYVGSKAQMEEMVRAIEVNNIKPVVDKEIFTLENARDAYEYMVCFFPRVFDQWRLLMMFACYSGTNAISARLLSRSTRKLKSINVNFGA